MFRVAFVVFDELLQSNFVKITNMCLCFEIHDIFILKMFTFQISRVIEELCLDVHGTVVFMASWKSF